MKNLLLVTVDCDLRCNNIDLRQKSLDKLLEVFAEVKATGHITWFLNENDFVLTKKHQSFLIEAIQRGDTLGLHDHFELFKGQYEQLSILEFCRRSKGTLQEWLAKNGHNDEIIFHRNGALTQHPVIYAVLKELGYKVVSDVYPGHNGADLVKHPNPVESAVLKELEYKVVSDVYPGHSGADLVKHPFFNNRSMPPGIMPYRHDEENFQDYRCSKGNFLQIPIMHMGMADLDFIQMDHWLKLFANQSVESGVLLWLFHPYEILDDVRTKISIERLQILRSHLNKCRTEFKLNFTNMEELLVII